jgi:divalent metal cation (Fe/Co/Zn/Cd) transporter
VILGLLLVTIGEKFNISWLRVADPLAALAVACVVVTVSWRLATQTMDALLDAAPTGIRNQVIGAVQRVPGVIEVDRVRIRRAGNHYFADLTVGFGRNLTFQRSDQLAAEVVATVTRLLPDVDVVVHSTALPLRGENMFDRIRAVASSNNLGVHDISIQDLDGRLHVEQHLELNERLSLKEAHDFVTVLESEIREKVPEISTILTHIESEPATIETAHHLVEEPALEEKLRAVTREFPQVIDLHDFEFKRVAGKLYVSCHCTMSDTLPLSRVHEVMTAIETRFKQVDPELFRVLIHPEPQTDNLR